ncbi:MAG: fatty acid desaturase [Bacteroidetes bacterium]|nr:fatty acid desaturase [Bacteroidota bacterium]
MDTFETIDKATIVNSKGVKYLDFRDTLSPRYAVVWSDIAIGYLALLAVLAGAVYMQMFFNPWFAVTIAIGGLCIGYIVSALHLFIHEASHYHLAPARRQNDILSNIFLGLLVGMDVEFYRTVHFAHHRLLGTATDTERSYFDAISWRYIIESLTGIRVLRVILHRNENIKKNAGSQPGLRIIRQNNTIFAIAAILHLALVSSLLAVGYWQAALVWIVGMGAAFPLFATFRQILEHRSEQALASVDYSRVDHGVVHRMFGEGPVASTLGAAGFNRHLLHHWDPQVSYTRLRDVEAFLRDTTLREDQESRQTTYFKTFAALIRK